jgi:dolichol-phosphate mannosyltransferase
VALSLVIPCYNESAGIEPLALQLAKVMPDLQRWEPVELVFVDDGCTDDTYSRIRTAFAGWPHLQLARHPRNLGLGAALRTGIAHATGNVLVVIDSDCTYPLSTIPGLLNLLTPEIDVVTSSCLHPDGGVDGVPPYRLLLSKCASLGYRVLVDWRIHTWTAMYRAYRREVVQQVTTESSGYVVMAELLAKAIVAGYRVTEFPTVLHVRKHGQSKARIGRIIVQHLRLQARLAAWRLAALVGLRSARESRP